METETLIIMTILLPFCASILNFVLHKSENIRDLVTLLISIVTFCLVLRILILFNQGVSFDVSIINIFPKLDLGFNIEPLGLLFAVVASGLWIVTHIYAIGYMRGNKEKNQTRFFAFYSIAIFCAAGLLEGGNTDHFKKDSGRWESPISICVKKIRRGQ